MQKIKIYKLNLTFKVSEDLRLPQFKGSIFHSTFGNAFRRTVCVTRAKNCDGCQLKSSCSYILVFETEMPPNDLPYLKNVAKAPHPYIINTASELKTEYKKGDKITVELIIIGDYIKMLPYFIYTFQQLGKRGIGSNKTKLDLLKVNNIINKTEKKQIFDSTTNNIQLDVKPIKFSGQNNIQFPATLIIKFISPLRLQLRGKVIQKREKITPELFTEALLRRYNIVKHLFFKNKITDYSELENGLTIKHNNLIFKQFHRYSAKQKQEMKFGGLLGEMEIEINSKKIMDMLIVCKELNIGKNVSFGMGKYTLEIKHPL